MNLSGFCTALQIGHMTCVKRVVGYLCKMRHGKIRFQTNLPDYLSVPDEHYGWENSIDGNVTEIVPHDAPPPKGLPVIITTYVHANLCHYITTGNQLLELSIY